jgi:hypothetical protein
MLSNGLTRFLPIAILIMVTFSLTSAQTVRLGMRQICCDKTTEAGADEVYILVYGRRSDGQATFEQRLPGPGMHWDMNDGDQPTDNPNGDAHCRTNKNLFTGEIPAGQSWDVVVLVMEEDGGTSAQWQRAASSAAIKSGNPYAIAAGSILAVYTSLFGAIINDTDDYIGSFAAHITNDCGSIHVDWRPIDRVAHMIPDPNYPGNANRREFRMNGDGSNHVGWYYVDPTSTTANPVSPSRFYIDYAGEPEPGKRYWSRADQSTWIERYPSGKETVQQVIERTTVAGDLGTVVGPKNEKTFQVFIPDKCGKLMWVRFRHQVQGKWQEWSYLGEMRGIQY